MKQKFIIACAVTLLLLSLPVRSQDAESSESVELSLGTVRTTAEAAAVKFLAEYAEGLDDIFITNASKVKKAGVDTGSILDLSPEVSIETGDEDSFNGVIAKMTGNYMRVQLKDIPDPIDSVRTLQVGDLDKLVHVIPISVGFEGDRNFDSVSAILETGYIPLLIPRGVGFQHKIGIFAQAGYKFDANAEGEEETGGAQDQSAEGEDSSILRLKGRAGTQLCVLGKNKACWRKINDENWGVNVILDASGWYDINNSEVYHSLEAILRLTLFDGRHFDLKYQDGSGAPNFNEGEEFSANLTVQF